MKEMAKKLSLVFAVFLVVFLASRLVWAGARWDFSSSVENFISRGNANIRHSNDGDGRMYMDTYGNDPGAVKHELSIIASENNLFKAYIWTYCSDKTCELFFKRLGSSNIYFGGSVYLSYGSSGGEYAIDLSSNSNWQGTITEIRIDPTSSCGTLESYGFIAFDWIAFEQKNGSITGGVRNIDEYKGGAQESSHGQNFLNSITKIPKKSIASANGNRAKNIPPSTLEYFNSGGFETLMVETSINNSSAKDVIFVKNQAGWMIHTGHGSSSTAEIKLRKSDTLLEEYFNADGSKWNEDMDGVLMFCCSILDIDDLNDNYPTASPGIYLLYMTDGANAKVIKLL